MYMFLSIGAVHTGKNLGCCIVEVERPSPVLANNKLKALGLMPKECHQIRAYPLSDEEFAEQGMELNRMYSPSEMQAMGFEKA